MSGSWREGRNGPRAMQEIGWHFSSFLLHILISFSFIHTFPHSVIFLYPCPFFMYLPLSLSPDKCFTISYTLPTSLHSLFFFHLSPFLPIPLSSVLPPHITAKSLPFLLKTPEPASYQLTSIQPFLISSYFSS